MGRGCRPTALSSSWALVVAMHFAMAGQRLDRCVDRFPTGLDRRSEGAVFGEFRRGGHKWGGVFDRQIDQPFDRDPDRIPTDLDRNSKMSKLTVDSEKKTLPDRRPERYSRPDPTKSRPSLDRLRGPIFRPIPDRPSTKPSTADRFPTELSTESRPKVDQTAIFRKR